MNSMAAVGTVGCKYGSFVINKMAVVVVANFVTSFFNLSMHR